MKPAVMKGTAVGNQSMSDLGRPVIEHRARRSARATNLALAALGLGLGGVLFVVGISRWSFALRTFGPALVGRWSQPWLAAGIVLLLLGTLAGIWLLRWNWASVVVHDRGLRLKSLRRWRELPWTQIEAVQVSGVHYRLIWGSRSTLHLRTSAGRVIRLNDTLVGLNQLAATVKRNVYPRLLTEYTRFLRDGQPVPFGPLVVAPDGLVYRRRKLNWSEVAAAELQDGKLRITPAQDRGGPLRVDARRVPNPEICLQLVQHYAKGAAGG